MSAAAGRIQILDGDAGPDLPIVEGQGVARAIVWPGVDAHSRSLHRIWLGPGSQTVELAHPSSEAVYYVVDGEGSVADRASGRVQDLRLGSMFHVDPGTPYAVVAGDGGMQLLGGPAPADAALYAHLARRD